MISKNMTTFVVDEKNMIFDSEVFNSLFKSAAKNKSITFTQLEESIADDANLSREAVHNWRFGTNGPAELQTIKTIATTMSITDFKVLLKETGTGKVQQLNERQKNAVKRIYDTIIDFLWKFQATDGFNDLWLEISDDHPSASGPAIKNTLMDLVEKDYYEIEHQYRKEYFDLRNHPIYRNLGDLIYGKDDETNHDEYLGLSVIYDGKLSYAYRFEAQVDGHPTTQEDYEKGLKMINSIIDEYMDY